VFLSSTYYDLRHVRSSLETFIQSLGFDAVLSEKGRIAYMPDMPLDESCYHEVSNTDLFVLIIGGRYGAEASATATKSSKTFYERYNSITRGEYQSAVARGVPIYILIERLVYGEYATYLKNRARTDVSYAHVDSVNIFALIDEILAQPRNNPVQQFDRYEEIELWLREQWAGLFREMLQRSQTHAQLASLQAEVAQLSELNKTLKTYLEEVVAKVAPSESHQLIESETKRLEEAKLEALLRAQPIGEYLLKIDFSPGEAKQLVLSVKTIAELVDVIVQRRAALSKETFRLWMSSNLLPTMEASLQGLRSKLLQS